MSKTSEEMTSKDEKIAELTKELAAVRAERDEIRSKYELQLDVWKCDGAKIAELATKCISLCARIEAAPKVWIRWNLHGRVVDAQNRVEPQWGEVYPGDEIRQVHAVPVFDHIVDANKKDEGHK